MFDEPDDILIAGAQQGDRRAFGALTTRHRDAIYGFACRMLGDREQAFDASQETFIKAWTGLGKFDTGRPFKPWLFAIAAHVCTDMLRRRRAPTVSLDDPQVGQPAAGVGTNPEHALAGRDTAERIAGGLAELSAEQRLALVLKHVQGFSYEEISEMTGQPVNTLKSHVHRARGRLAEIIGDPMEARR